MRIWLLLAATALALVGCESAATTSAAERVGVQGRIGCGENPQVIERLEISRPGVYENFRVDGRWGTGNRVKITADGVTLRHCEIVHCAGNGVGVFGNDIVIENCKIHHCLRGTFAKPADAHGITGQWGNVVIRNCEISHVSGDAVQFDPDRRRTGKVTIEQCTFWTGPLAEDREGFKSGERPGENAVDTKTPAGDERCELVIRNCYFHGWNQPAQISNAAALNLKEQIRAEISHCVLADNEIAFRVRGPGERGGAHVTIRDCAIDSAAVGIRAEDKIESLKIDGLAFGAGVKQRIRFVGGRPESDYVLSGERDAPSLQILLDEGFPTAE